MSKTKNEERLEIVNKRLAEINDKDIFPKKEKIEATIELRKAKARLQAVA